MDSFIKEGLNILQGGANKNENQGRRNDDNDDDNGGQGYGGHGGRQGQMRPEGDYDRRNDRADYSQDEALNNQRNEGNYGGRDDQYNDGNQYGGSNNYGEVRNRRNNEGGYSQEEAFNRRNDNDSYGGGQEYRPPVQGGGHGAGGYGGGGYSDNDDDLRGAHSTALKHADNQEDDGLFSQALGMLSGKKQGGGLSGGVDEQEMVRAHQQNYGNSSGSTDSGSIGSAAAMQALKMFTGGSGGGASQGGQGAFVGMAMSQAANLFNQKQANGQVQSGDKQSAVNQAAMMAMKMYMQSQGGGSGGGAGGLMGLASKFL